MPPGSGNIIPVAFVWSINRFLSYFHIELYHLRFMLSIISMHFTLILQFVALLTLANGTPLVAKRLLGTFLNHPLDGGAVFFDGLPLFGPSKTIRGIILSIVVTTVFAPVLALDWKSGLMAATMAMAGDLLSSFVKRRLKFQSSSRATALDQIPEVTTSGINLPLNAGP